MIHRRVVVSGDVQGVFFRDTCRREAVRAGVTGWVRNLDDGTVEAVFEGSPEAVQLLLSWAHRGPLRATVTGVEVSDGPVEGFEGYEIR
ncbi:acylphosphatase [Actinoplanes sp. NPDC051470]|uniref:acylphosphatase n=1 Tax=Actinoplanes sp. NPDC051470 TaxID=3157224 RepID=UPI00344820D8